MKKSAGDEEKERRKREKKLRKEAKGSSGVGVTGSMSTDELLRLEEVRRSLKIRGRRKEKEKLPSGITADYSADFFAALNADTAPSNGSGNGNGSAGPEQDRGNEEIVASVMTHIESRSVANGSGIGINLNYGEVTHTLLAGGLKVNIANKDYLLKICANDFSINRIGFCHRCHQSHPSGVY